MADPTQMTEAPTHSRPLYEASDIDPRRVILIGAGLLATVLVIMTVTYIIYGFVSGRYLGRQPPASSLAHTRAPTPEPHLSVNAPEELRQLRATENAALNSYAWVDKENGTVRIPIDRAIEVLAKKGLPTRSERGEATTKTGTTKVTKRAR
jgi:hypothetical protein